MSEGYESYYDYNEDDSVLQVRLCKKGGARPSKMRLIGCSGESGCTVSESRDADSRIPSHTERRHSETESKDRHEITSSFERFMDVVAFPENHLPNLSAILGTAHSVEEEEKFIDDTESSCAEETKTLRSNSETFDDSKERVCDSQWSHLVRLTGSGCGSGGDREIRELRERSPSQDQANTPHCGDLSLPGPTGNGGTFEKVMDTLAFPENQIGAYQDSCTGVSCGALALPGPTGKGGVFENTMDVLAFPENQVPKMNCFECSHKCTMDTVACPKLVLCGSDANEQSGHNQDPSEFYETPEEMRASSSTRKWNVEKQARPTGQGTCHSLLDIVAFPENYMCARDTSVKDEQRNRKPVGKRGCWPFHGRSPTTKKERGLAQKLLDSKGDVLDLACNSMEDGLCVGQQSFRLDDFQRKNPDLWIQRDNSLVDLSAVPRDGDILLSNRDSRASQLYTIRKTLSLLNGENDAQDPGCYCGKQDEKVARTNNGDDNDVVSRFDADIPARSVTDDLIIERLVLEDKMKGKQRRRRPSKTKNKKKEKKFMERVMFWESKSKPKH